MEITECPKCGRPRALGHRCPSCGDAATAVDGQSSKESNPWQTAATQSDVARTATAQPALKPRRKIDWRLPVAAAVSLAIVAVAVTVVMTRDAGGSEKKEADGFAASLQAQVAELTGEGMGRPPQEAAQDHNSDARAQSLLSGARQTMDRVIADLETSGEYPISEYEAQIREAVRSTNLTPLRWEWSGPGVYARPLSTARASENTVSWSFTPPGSYELGTWSDSGAAIGLRANRATGSCTFYKDGAAF